MVFWEKYSVFLITKTEFINLSLLNRYLLGTYHMPDAALGIWD